MNQETNLHCFRRYRNFWTGISIMILLYSIIYGATGTHGMGLILGILMSLTFTPIAFGIISGLIFLVTWIFKKELQTQTVSNDPNGSAYDLSPIQANCFDSIRLNTISNRRYGRMDLTSYLPRACKTSRLSTVKKGKCFLSSPSRGSFLSAWRSSSLIL